MAFRWLLILTALLLGGGPLFAASAKEQRAYAAAVAAFQDEMWGRAETEFAQFRQKYPKSTNAPEAVLLQAQAAFKQGKLADTIALLADTNRLARAGRFADQYVYWIGEAQFQKADLANAATTFVSLTRNYPGSPLRLRAVVEAAAARAELGDWPAVNGLLQETNGVFQRAAQLDPANELITRGRLLLAQADFVQKDFAGASAMLASANSQALAPELDWQRGYLLYQVKLALGDTNAALAVTTNLLQIAPAGTDPSRHAESVALHAGLLEDLGLKAEALVAYQENLTNAPAEQQRQAILKTAELAAGLGEFPMAESALETFISEYSNSPAADLALLSLGELHLQDYATQPAATNQLPATNQLSAAWDCFNQFLGSTTNNPLAGKAYLDRGWCEWLTAQLAGNRGDVTNVTPATVASLADFQAAAEHLPPSPDLAVARFKMGDAQFALTNYAGALENYRAVLNDFTDFPEVNRELGGLALYQSLRACLELRDEPGASHALAQMLSRAPAGELAPRGTLLYGEGLAATRRPAQARAEFRKFLAQWPASPLRPSVELAIARTYEQETNWPAAIGLYEDWLKNSPTNDLAWQAHYALAWANYQAGNETNAFILFTNFVAQYPSNSLAPLAQYWVADHFFRAGDLVNAEKNYKFVFQNFPPNDLSDPARMMAGRAAMGRQDYKGAIDYFSTLEVDTNCPATLRVQAAFTHGAALMRMDSPDPNNSLLNFQLATNVFSQLCQLYPTNEAGALAWLYIGKCDLQLTNYDAATNAFAQVFNSPSANAAARSQAQIGFGMALEKMAAETTGDDQKALQELALKNYLDVLYENNLRDGEQADAFWTKKAGLQALPLVETLGESPPADFFRRLETWLPQLKDSLEKQAANLSAAKK